MRPVETRALRQASADARRAMRAIRRAERAAWRWVDTVRADVERRAGMEAGDLRVLEDPAYAAALDRCSALQRIGEEAARALASWQPSAAPGEPAVESARATQAEPEAER